MGQDAKALSATYMRPVGARLVVRLENGEEWEATPKDFETFGLATRRDLYREFLAGYRTVLGLGAYSGDPTETALNVVRYLVEQTVCHGEGMAPTVNSDDADIAAEILAIEDALRTAWGGPEIPGDVLARWREVVTREGEPVL